MKLLTLDLKDKNVYPIYDIDIDSDDSVETIGHWAKYNDYGIELRKPCETVLISEVSRDGKMLWRVLYEN